MCSNPSLLSTLSAESILTNELSVRTAPPNWPAALILALGLVVPCLRLDGVVRPANQIFPLTYLIGDR